VRIGYAGAFGLCLGKYVTRSLSKELMRGALAELLGIQSRSPLPAANETCAVEGRYGCKKLDIVMAVSDWSAECADGHLATATKLRNKRTLCRQCRRGARIVDRPERAACIAVVGSDFNGDNPLSRGGHAHLDGNRRSHAIRKVESSESR
jgi:hypothetical protein